MRVGFRILILKQGKRLYKEDLQGDTLFERALRYISEFKYLEATKWLLLCEDSLEKYLLLSLINFALGQYEQSIEFMKEAKRFQKSTDFSFLIEKPGLSELIIVDKPEASLFDFLSTYQKPEEAR
ncbi:MAG: hypothetical protein NZL90_00530 [Aquificaceae bacterium]|nr:hypothetical protein [Aquificaceae bacterium]MDW8237024.1 hypothetical protein [Aquificaceae bacterium]